MKAVQGSNLFPKIMTCIFDPSLFDLLSTLLSIDLVMGRGTRCIDARFWLAFLR